MVVVNLHHEFCSAVFCNDFDVFESRSFEIDEYGEFHYLSFRSDCVTRNFVTRDKTLVIGEAEIFDGNLLLSFEYGKTSRIADVGFSETFVLDYVIFDSGYSVAKRDFKGSHRSQRTDNESIDFSVVGKSNLIRGSFRSLIAGGNHVEIVSAKSVLNVRVEKTVIDNSRTEKSVTRKSDRIFFVNASVKNSGFVPVSVIGKEGNRKVYVVYGFERDETFDVNAVFEIVVHISLVFVGKNDYYPDGRGFAGGYRYNSVVERTVSDGNAIFVSVEKISLAGYRTDNLVYGFGEYAEIDIIGKVFLAIVDYVETKRINALPFLVVAEIESYSVGSGNFEISSRGRCGRYIDHTGALFSRSIRHSVDIGEYIRSGHRKLPYSVRNLAGRKFRMKRSDVLTDDRCRSSHIGRSHTRSACVSITVTVIPTRFVVISQRYGGIYISAGSRYIHAHLKVGKRTYRGEVGYFDITVIETEFHYGGIGTSENLGVIYGYRTGGNCKLRNLSVDESRLIIEDNAGNRSLSGSCFLLFGEGNLASRNDGYLSVYVKTFVIRFAARTGNDNEFRTVVFKNVAESRRKRILTSVFSDGRSVTDLDSVDNEVIFSAAVTARDRKRLGIRRRRSYDAVIRIGRNIARSAVCVNTAAAVVAGGNAEIKNESDPKARKKRS